MARMPRRFQQRPIIVRPRRGPQRRRFRWSWLTVPLVVLAAIWLAHGIVIGFSWDALMDQWGIINQKRFTRLAVLGVVVCGIVAVLRILRDRRREEDED